MRFIKYCVMVISICLTSVVFAATTQETIKDLGLEHKAKLAMILKKGVPSARLKTHADKGRLQIAGYVCNNKELTEVENAIKDYLKKDNDQIINNVIICSGKSNLVNDNSLAKHVKEHFDLAKIPVKDISIQVKNGHVMLSGFVDESIDINTATNIVKDVPGVIEVDNCLLHKKS